MNRYKPKQKVLVAVGTRPEAIKLAPLIRALHKDARFECRVCSTGQHQEMLQQVFDWFDIEADEKMNVMTHGQPLNMMAGRIQSGFQTVLENETPDIVIVHGDTTTAFMCALAAHYSYNIFKHKPIKVAHIEAGLRTYDKYAPFPEESNRRLIGHIADWHFAPTMTNAEALAIENIVDDVFIVGNSVIDALHETTEILKNKPVEPYPFIEDDGRIILVTGHRRENYGTGFDNICRALKEISALYPSDHIVYPVHLNPIVKDKVTEHLQDLENVHLVAPMDYPHFVAAMQQAHIILTDSGGIQEEAPALGKPVLVMREVTERPDAVAMGTVKLVGTNKEKIVGETCLLMDDEEAYKKMSEAKNPYGDGKSVERILNIMAGERGQENAFMVAGV